MRFAARSVFALAMLMLGLGSCATYQPNATAWVACSPEDCRLKWDAAQAWIARTGPYRISLANDSVIQTYGPSSGTTGYAYTLTKRVESPTRTVILITAQCAATVYGCFEDPATGANALMNYLTTVKP